MKVAFLKPPIGGILGLEMLTFVEPLGPIASPAALEPDGHECQVFDLRIDGEERGHGSLPRASRPQVVGLQCNFTTERFRTLRLAERVRRELPEAFVVVGGHDASRDPSGSCSPAIDAIAVGDGEEVMPALVDALERGADLAKVPGPGAQPARRRGRSPATRRRARDLDTLPMPARHLISHYAPHYYINFRKPLALMETARGCPFKCNFCSVWKFHESHLPREVARAGGARAARDRGAQRLHHRRHLLDGRAARRGDGAADQGRGHPQVLHRADAHRHHLQVPPPDRDVEGLRPARHLPRPRVGHRRGARVGQQEEHGGQQRPAPSRSSRSWASATPRTSSSIRPGTARTSPACATGSTRPAPTTAASRSSRRCPAPTSGTNGEPPGDHARLGDVRHRPRRAADEAAAARSSTTSTPASGGTSRRALPPPGQRQHLRPARRGARHRQGDPGRGAQGHEHRLGKVFSKPETFLRAHRESESRIAEMRNVLAEASQVA